MEYKELDLRAMQIFLDRNISLGELLEELITLLVLFSLASMKASIADDVPIGVNEVNSVLCIQNLIDVFKNIKEDNENK